MERNRIIKPEFWRDDLIAELSTETKLFYIALWNFADDFGVISAKSTWIKAVIFTKFNEFSLAKISKITTILEKKGRLLRFTYKKQEYFYIVNFRKHQKIDKRWAKYLIPLEEIRLIISTLMLESRNENSDEYGVSGRETEKYISEPAGSFTERLSRESQENPTRKLNKNIIKYNGNELPPHLLHEKRDKIKHIADKYFLEKMPLEMAELIAYRVDDFDAWEEAVRFWAAKGYNTDRIADLLNRYEKIAKYRSVETTDSGRFELPQFMPEDDE